jgi:large subunit ribosomal protein L35
MPKNKTHSGMKKRIKVTGGGKLLHARTNRRHNFEHKPSTRTRRLFGEVALTKSDEKKARRLLGL